ncbi:DUF4382 domain-containing protein [Myxococcota bacterium]|nr:DUF4382 domain-containing protein [Myxococcota bacterium]
MRIWHSMLWVTGLGLATMGCSSDDATSGTSGGQGRVEVRLTDAPGPYEAVPITIARVEAHRSGGAAADPEDAGAGDAGVDGDGDDGGGWIVLVDTPQTHDLLQLQNGVEAALGGRDLPAGHYTQIRLILSDANVVVGGATEPLKVPSGFQTGFKLNHDFHVEADTTYALVLDFDAQASIKETGAGYLLTPVLSVKSFEPIPESADAGAAAGGADGG